MRGSLTVHEVCAEGMLGLRAAARRRARENVRRKVLTLAAMNRCGGRSLVSLALPLPLPLRRPLAVCAVYGSLPGSAGGLDLCLLWLSSRLASWFAVGGPPESLSLCTPPLRPKNAVHQLDSAEDVSVRVT